jgi:hypothetical protein
MGRSRRSNCVGAHASSHPRAQDRTRASFLPWRSWMGATPAELRCPLHLGRPPAGTAPQGAQTLALRSHIIRRPLGFFPKAAATPCSHPLGFSPFCITKEQRKEKQREKQRKGRVKGRAPSRRRHPGTARRRHPGASASCWTATSPPRTTTPEHRKPAGSSTTPPS